MRILVRRIEFSWVVKVDVIDVTGAGGITIGYIPGPALVLNLWIYGSGKGL